MGEGARDSESSDGGGITRPVTRAFDSVARLTELTPPGDRPDQLRTSLGDALRREGFGSLAADQSPLAGWFAGLIAKAVVAFGLLAAVMLPLDIESSALAGVLAGVLFVVIFSSLEVLTFPRHPERFWGIYLFVLAWLAAGVWLAATRGPMYVTASHVAPVLAGFLLARMFSEPGTLKRVGETLADGLRGVPLAFPVTMLILFAVTLTSEVWESAHEESIGRLVGFAAVAILPQLLILVQRLFRSIPDDFRSVADELDRQSEAKLARLAVERLRAINGKRRGQWIDDGAQMMLEESYRDQEFARRADEICEEMQTCLRVRIATRLGLTVLGVALLVFVYVYALVLLTVDWSTARTWSKIGEGQPQDEWLLGLPGDPYVNVALVLAIVAAAVFLAFVVTASDMVDKLSGDYVHEPAKIMLLLATASDALHTAFAPGTVESPTEPERDARSATPVPAPG